MKFSELRQLIEDRGAVNVTCMKGIDDLETYAEPGMRLTITGGDEQHDGVLKLRVSYEDFDEFNKQFESANYFDGNRQPVLTAREAGFYKVKDTIYVMADDEFERFFSTLDSTKLYDQYKAERSNIPYVQWLENKVEQLSK